MSFHLDREGKLIIVYCLTPRDWLSGLGSDNCYKGPRMLSGLLGHGPETCYHGTSAQDRRYLELRKRNAQGCVNPVCVESQLEQDCKWHGDLLVWEVLEMEMLELSREECLNIVEATFCYVNLCGGQPVGSSPTMTGRLQRCRYSCC